MFLPQSSEFIQKLGLFSNLWRSPNLQPFFSVECSLWRLLFFSHSISLWGKGFLEDRAYISSPRVALMLESTLSEALILQNQSPHIDPVAPFMPPLSDLQGLSKCPRAHSSTDTGHIHSEPPVKIPVGLGVGTALQIGRSIICCLKRPQGHKWL